ncbi:tyrosine-type recombinase/integrase [Rugamonas sp. DEMB1]|uniref:tyrosine-type recombinase/integrase n=1 Tax=Rugamonas sp. DEMB1 TaxID=3039386 RepID=UPI00244774E6|nr:integrase arm-type DNA-binding domain-containing protein [Rugamonas sp. DEMB1]WGG52596.1 integrase arm-type DNA-binding domain-containing protein [Rugamonas sp. DEMB1]
MPKLAVPLTDAKVKTAKPREKAYTLPDGGGMYLEVGPSGSKIWRMAYRQPNGKNTRLTFGPYPEVSLLQAREKRADARKLRVDGIDPAKAKRDQKLALATAAVHTFETLAREWLAKTAAERAATTQAKNTSWLERNIFPEIGAMPISTIKAPDVLAALRKIEARGAIESAHKIKQLCGQVFRFAVSSGLAEHDVTAGLRDALAAVPEAHYAAITEPKLVADLLRSIHAYGGHSYATVALKLSPLLFQRPGELRSMEWAEVDLDAAEWRIPGAKMKMKSDHIVPLARQAVELLRAVRPMTGHGQYVFPSIRTGERCMSNNTINAALRSLGYDKEVMTGHGFRAMARTILDEVLGERVDLIEHQLAHAVKDPNGRAYNRTAHLPARRAMMQRWADYLDKLRAGADVVPLRGEAA